jgi:Ca-activated chloride channel family protein
MSLTLKAAALALLTLALPIRKARAQQNAPIGPPSFSNTSTLHLQSRLVSIALNVTNQRGEPVPYLNASDFNLTEDSRPQAIAFFDKASTTPLDIVLAIDASESVSPYEHLEHQAARTFIHSLLRPQDRIELLAFSDHVDKSVAFTNDPRRIDHTLDHIKHGNATALYDAIGVASRSLFELLSPANTRRVIVLISDGENTTRHGTYISALEAAQRADAIIDSLIIIPVAADAGRDTGGEHALIQLSSDTGGESFDIEQQADLATALTHVSNDLRTQYTIGYYAPRSAAAAPSLRHIHLQLNNPALRAKYTLRYRTAYYASPQP